MTLATAPDLDLEPWPVWLSAILPDYCTAPFAQHHVAFWEWVWGIEPGERPEAFVGVWARGGAKSTSAEAACVALGARRKRRYGLYVCDTQDRADDHVGNVAAMLESVRVELFYPGLASRQVGKYGNSRGWRRNRLWTRDGFVLDAIGLDSAARGVKLEEQRPDLFVVDDVDGLHDTAAATARKVETITHSVIPAGASDAAILAIQNLVKRDGVFDQMATGRAEFLRRRILSGPIPAVEGLEVERGDDGLDHVTAGVATWDGQSLAQVEEQINDWGYPAFLREAQHEVTDSPGALWSQAQIDACRVEEQFEIDAEQIIVSVDPSGGAGPGHDEQGIVAVARGVDGHGYVLADWTCSLSPMGWGKRAVELAVLLEADAIIVEGNYGGAMTGSTVQQAAESLVREGNAAAGTYAGARVEEISASASKEERARGCAARYEEKERPETWAAATMHHVGAFADLEREMVTWEPDVTTRSPNRLDALAHGVKRLGIQRRRLRFRP